MKFLLIISCLVINFQVFGQKRILKRAKQAQEFYEKGDKEEAVKIYEDLANRYPKTEQYGKNLFNTAKIYDELDRDSLAILFYSRILDADLEDAEEDNTRGIFETHANYKHYSAVNLGAIEYNNQEFEKALNYYKLARTKYRYFNYSGTDIKNNSMGLASRISDCYLELDSIESALVSLLPHGLTTSPNPKNYIADIILRLVEQYSNRQKFRDDLFKAIEKSEQIEGGLELEMYSRQIRIYPYMRPTISKDDLRKSMLIAKLK